MVVDTDIDTIEHLNHETLHIGMYIVFHGYAMSSYFGGRTYH